MKSNDNKFYMKNIAFDEIYNFVVNFFIWDLLLAQIFISEKKNSLATQLLDIASYILPVYQF